jgi:hypothetical protein
MQRRSGQPSRCGQRAVILAALLALSCACLSTSLVTPFEEGQQCNSQFEEEAICSLTGGEGLLTPGPDQYIVRFRDYAPVEEQHSRLSQAFAGEGTEWCWVPRHNRAASHPTDFGLVTADGGLSQLAERLANIPFVRDVHRDKRYTGTLSWVPEGDLKAVFADAGVGAHGGDSADSVQQQAAWDGGSGSFAAASNEEHDVIKRSGRLSTPFMMDGEDNTLEEEEEEVGLRSEREHDRLLIETSEEGYAASLPRRVGSRSMMLDLSQDNQRRALRGRGTITDKMQAGPLWKEGFSGKGVKV